MYVGEAFVLGDQEDEDEEAAAMQRLDEEARRSRAGTSQEQGGSTSNPDPGRSSRLGKMDSKDVASIRKKFPFLNEFTDNFVSNTPLDILLKMESTAIKIQDFEKNKLSATKLTDNRNVLLYLGILCS